MHGHWETQSFENSPFPFSKVVGNLKNTSEKKQITPIHRSTNNPINNFDVHPLEKKQLY